MPDRLRFSRIVYIVLFLCALWSPVMQMHFKVFEEYEEAEKRELAEPPELSLNSLGQLPDQFTGFAADNFGFRPDLIRWNSILKTTLLGVSPIPSVILGKDSWLFYNSEALADGNSINDFRGTIPLPDSELVRLKERIEENQKQFSSRGILYVVVIVPNKNTVYAEYLPDSITRVRPLTRLDQLLAFMEHESEIRILDLRETFRRAKIRYPIYWKTDSHWNNYGAYIAYLEIMKHLANHFPDLHSIPIANAVVNVKTNPVGGDLAQMLSMQDLLYEENETEFGLANSPENKPLGTLLFRHDSFGDNLYPYFHRHFKRIVNMAPFTTYKFDMIDKERPAIVLHVFAERYITQALHDDFYYGEQRL